MKQLFTFLFLAISAVVFSQAPQSIPYQAVVRNTDGTMMANAAATITFKIHDNSATGTVVYEETHTTTTNAQGLVSLNVGGGTAMTGTFSGIQWGSGSKFLHVLMNAGNGVIDLGTQQMMSVPYALYAEDVNVRVSVTGDSLFIGDQVSIVPGVSAANPVPFYTEGQGAVDSQGNSYSTIVVGDQEWLEGYLKSDFFNNGERIDMHDLGQCYAVGGPGIWGNYNIDTIIPMIADYWLVNGQRAAHDSLFGHYYSLGSLINDKNVCPVNWKVPASNDIKVLMKRIKNDLDTSLNEIFLNQFEFEVFWEILKWKITPGGEWIGETASLDDNMLAYDLTALSQAVDSMEWIVNVLDFGSNLTWVLSDFRFLTLEPIDSFWVLRILNGNDVTGMLNHGIYFATKCVKNVNQVDFGCTNPGACNFHDWADEDDGSCYVPGQNCDDKNGNTYNDVVAGDCSCSGVLDTLQGVIGCENIQVSIEGCDGMNSILYFGEEYDLVELGGQCWFAEDLKTLYNRDSLPLIYLNSSNFLDYYCESLYLPAIYDEISPPFAITDTLSYNARAYNKAVVVENEVCPYGWSIPTECDWKYMLASLGATPQELNTSSIGCEVNLNGDFRMFNSYSPGFWDTTNQKEKKGFNGALNNLSVISFDGIYKAGNGLNSYWWFGDEQQMISYPDSRSLYIDDLNLNLDSNTMGNNCIFSSLRCIKNQSRSYGCKDVTACNYNFYANTEDGSCLHVGDVCNDSALQTLNDVINNACECVGQLVLDTIINPGNGVQDIDGNHYSTVIIGNQEWMAENLKTTRFNNGDAINYFERGSICMWTNLSVADSAASYLIYNNQSEKNALYGKLYNKSVVEDDRNVCPSGWVVPGFQEWNQLIVHLDSQAQFTYAPNSLNLNSWYSLTAGDQLKSNQTWMSPTSSGNSSFNALASGWVNNYASGQETAYTDIGESFTGQGILSYWWIKGSNNPSYFCLSDNSSAVYFGQDFGGASSIRCVKAQ